MFGNPISFELRPDLTAYRGKLLSGAELGAPVHAAAFIRKRIVVLETDLLAQSDRLRLILTHEIFHFAWARLGNSQRSAFSELLANEIKGRARGEIGESADIKKRLLRLQGFFDEQCRLWRDYVCESFCDSAAAFYSGTATDEYFTLAGTWVKRRYAWLVRASEGGWQC